MHPVVIRHPDTGRQALYVNPEFTMRFDGWTEGMPARCSIIRPEFTSRFQRRKGSLAFWDNRSTWHFALNARTFDPVFDFGGKRSDLSTYVAKLARALNLPDWRLHDLRRTMVSGTQNLGIEPHVIDACLGHSALIKGVATVSFRGARPPSRDGPITWRRS